MRTFAVFGALALLTSACASNSDSAPNQSTAGNSGGIAEAGAGVIGTRSDPVNATEPTAAGTGSSTSASGATAALPVAGSGALAPPVAGAPAAVGGASGAAGAIAQAAGAAAPSMPPLPVDKPTWKSCNSGFQCATLKAPLDYANPSGTTIDLALMRLPARGQRIGSLLVNPGGPGGSAIDFLSGFAGSASALSARFDLVAFDPRGVGQSTPINCHSTLKALIAADPSPDSDAAWTTLDDASKTFADECEQKQAALLPYLGTPNVARDMDRVREAVGDDKLHYLGFSYGTEIGAWYAQLFPTRVGQLVLDGAVDVRLSALDLAYAQGLGFELALSDYFKWCTQAATNCSWAQNKTPSTEFTRLASSVKTKPLPASRSDRPVGPGEFSIGTIAPLYGGEDGWRVLSSALAAAESGDGNALMSQVEQYLGRAADGSYSNETEANNAVNCLDRASPTVAQVRAQADRFKMAAPNFGLTALTQLLLCSHWPVAGQDVPPPQGVGAAPIVVVGTTNDPATPYAWAGALAMQLASGVLLTADGEGHTAYGRGNACIDDAVNAYFISGTVPAKGAHCNASGMSVPTMLRLAPMR
jgi:pimeloyl-ACP methyl ester carboxylesterase